LDLTFVHCALDEKTSNKYADNINIYAKYIKIPFILLYMVISKKVNILNFLIISLIATVITGYMIAVYVDGAGHSTAFVVFYIISESLDDANVILLITMLNNKMTMETRGFINSIAQIVLQLAGTLLNSLNASMMQLYKLPEKTIHGTTKKGLPCSKKISSYNYAKGAKDVLIVNYSILGVIVLCIIAYRVYTVVKGKKD